MKNIIDFEIVINKNEKELMKYIDERFKIIAIELGILISYESYRKIYYYLCRNFMGFNEIDPILKDYFIEDIECNGIDTPLYIVHRVYRNIRTNLNYRNVENLASFFWEMFYHASYACMLIYRYTSILYVVSLASY
jgi:Flp pilus assembly CpaF family ATPase